MKLREFHRRYFQEDSYTDFRALCGRIPGDLGVPKSWGSTSHIFTYLIEKLKPRSIVEIGSWKGTSAIHIARQAVKYQPEVAVMCVDTWLASNASLWKDKTVRQRVLKPQLEYSLYGQFLLNVLHAGLEKQILPFRNTSALVLQLMQEKDVRVDLIYIDGGHSESEVTADLIGAWNVIIRGGVVVGDDFTNFPGVGRAVREFSKSNQVPYSLDGQKWWIWKR